jgi:hypothetical protein
MSQADFSWLCLLMDAQHGMLHEVATHPLVAPAVPLHRPKVTSPGSDVEVNSVDDVQRLYLLLEPHQPPGGKCRCATSFLKDGACTVAPLPRWLRPSVAEVGCNIDACVPLVTSFFFFCRMLVVAKKRLPDTQRHERFFAFVGE